MHWHIDITLCLLTYAMHSPKTMKKWMHITHKVSVGTSTYKALVHKALIYYHQMSSHLWPGESLKAKIFLCKVNFSYSSIWQTTLHALSTKRVSIWTSNGTNIWMKLFSNSMTLWEESWICINRTADGNHFTLHSSLCWSANTFRIFHWAFSTEYFLDEHCGWVVLAKVKATRNW